MSAPTTEVLLPGLVSRCTEFVWDAHESRTITGDCGPDALSEGIAWADQVLCTASYVATTYDGMLAHGECASNGPSTIGGLQAAAVRLGLPAIERIGFANPLPNWHTWLLDRVGAKALVIEVANGQALTDYLTSKGENATHLQYHYILLVGYTPGGYSPRAGRMLPAGWWAADGDNFDQGDILQFYPDPVLAAAQPCAALAFSGRVAPRSAPMDTGFYGLTATNDAQVWACAQYKTTLGHGFLAFYKALVSPVNGACATQILGLPISDEYPSGALVRQDFERGYLLYDAGKANPWMIVNGMAGLDLRAAAQTIASLQKQLDAANSSAAQAQSALTAAQAQGKQAQDALGVEQAKEAAEEAAEAAAPPPPPPAPSISPAQQAVLDGVKALDPVLGEVEAALARISDPAATSLAVLAQAAQLPGAVEPLAQAARALVTEAKSA